MVVCRGMQRHMALTNQVAFFESAEELIGDAGFQWENTNKTLQVTSTTNHPLMTLSKDADVTAGESMISMSGTYKSTGQNDVALTVFDVDFDGSALANGSTVTGLDINVLHSAGTNGTPSKATGLHINVTDADTNVAAIVEGGFVGIGTTYPKVYLDVAGDVAFREYNYTGNSLPNGGNNCDFDGEGNRFSFLRIGSALAGQETITGFAGGYDGKMLKVYNATSEVIQVKNNSTSSNAGNRIMSSANADLLLLPGNTYEFLYSGVGAAMAGSFLRSE